MRTESLKASHGRSWLHTALPLVVFFGSVSLFSLGGCTKPIGTAERDMAIPPPQPTSVHGRVIGAKSGDRLANVSVGIPSLIEGIPVLTNARGEFQIPNAPTGSRVVLLAQREGLVDAVRPIEVQASVDNFIEITMAEVGIVARVSANAPISVTDGRGAQVDFDKDSLILPNGQPASGEVEVQLTALDPTDPGLLEAFPGDFIATRKDGSTVMLATVMPMDISVRQGGQELNIAPGKVARVHFPIPNAMRTAAPNMIEIWSLDVSSGIWKEETVAVRRGDVYLTDISHLSSWNADVPNDIACVKGLALYKGMPVPGAQVRSVGAYTDLRNKGRATTKADGTFTIEVKPSDKSNITASSASGQSSPLEVIAPSAPGSAINPASCLDVGTICINPSSPAAPAYCGPNCSMACAMNEICNMGSSDPMNMKKAMPTCKACPAGQLGCGGACTNVQTDSKNCGMCGKSCLTGQQCMAGKCVCTDMTKTLCMTMAGEECIDLKRDSKHCSMCGMACPLAGDICDNGTCKADCSDLKKMNPKILQCPDMVMKRDICVNPDSSRDHCGACGNKCGAMQTCINGKCETCLETVCGNDCANPNTSRVHCGMCDRGCAPNSICKTGSCTACAAPKGSRCDNMCIDQDADPENCGSCGNKCPMTSICMMGNCTPCAAGYTPCNGSCVDLTRNRNNCGACNNRCSDAKEEVCAASKCQTCPMVVPDRCDNECVDRMNDDRNCGMCGRACASGKKCSMGMCV